LQFKPSWDLSFTAGAFLGDGSFVEDSDYHHHVKLAVRDYDFAKAFNDSVATILGRRPNVVLVTSNKGKTFYESKYSCRPLGLFLERPLKQLLPDVSNYPAGFLRGLFSADGSAGVWVWNKRLEIRVELGNSDLELLTAVGSILHTSFQINSNIYLARRRGASWKNGYKTVILRKDAYQLWIQRLQDVRRFAKVIGFQIQRKQDRLERALRLVDRLGGVKAASRWRSLRLGRQAPEKAHFVE
jgi:intein-encoded DNA endonuclease-like protein